MRTFGGAVLLVVLVIIAGCGGGSSVSSAGDPGATLVVAFSEVGPDGSGLVLPAVNGATVAHMGDKIDPLVYDSKTGDPGGMALKWTIIFPDGHTMYRKSSELPLRIEYTGDYTFVADYELGGKLYHPQATLRVDSPK